MNINDIFENSFYNDLTKMEFKSLKDGDVLKPTKAYINDTIKYVGCNDGFASFKISRIFKAESVFYIEVEFLHKRKIKDGIDIDFNDLELILTAEELDSFSKVIFSKISFAISQITSLGSHPLVTPPMYLAKEKN